jgi:tetratricopeptide (TPR) repeat protein
MPPYCRTCPYNSICDEKSFSEDLCPMGYVPAVRSETMKTMAGSADEQLDIEILKKIGKNAYNDSDYERAIRCYDKILEVDPSNQEATFLKKRTEYIISELSGANELNQRPEGEGADTGTPLTLAQEPAIHVGHSKPVYYNSVLDHTSESKEVFTVQDSDRDKDGISKRISIRTHGSIVKKKGVEVVIALVIAILVILVIGLFLTGFLQF